MAGTIDYLERERIALDVAASEGNSERRVLVGGERLVVGRGRIVHRHSRERHGGRQTVVRTIVGQEREAVAAKVVGHWRIDQIGGGAAECAMQRLTDDLIRQRIAIHIAAAKRDGCRASSSKETLCGSASGTWLAAISIVTVATLLGSLPSNAQ